MKICQTVVFISHPHFFFEVLNYKAHTLYFFNFNPCNIQGVTFIIYTKMFINKNLYISAPIDEFLFYRFVNRQSKQISSLISHVNHKIAQSSSYG